MWWISERCTINFYWPQQQELQRLLYYLIVQNSYIKYSCLWETSTFSKLRLHSATSYIFSTRHWTSTLKQLCLENPERLIKKAISSYTAPDTVAFCCSAAIRMASPWNAKSCGLKTWARAGARQREGSKKKHYLPKRAVNFLLCAFTRDKVRKRRVEWRLTQRNRTGAISHSHICMSNKGEVHFTQLHPSI